MTTAKRGFFGTVASYPSSFWIANTMEIFERMAWYGWFTVMAVYVTGSVATGGLGFSEETRGALQGIVPCILYLLPVLTGALADRYGYKKMFIIAFLVMIIAYYSLGQFHTLPTFFMAFLFVAIGAAIFKPVVVGTVAHVTDASNSATAFGIFYMMVNIGGFVGPIIAGVVRGWGWKWVFTACSTWAAVNLLIVLFLYKEPTTEARSKNKRALKKVMDDLVEVLGNLRFFITVGVVIVALMIASFLDSTKVSWFDWKYCALVLSAWVAANFLYDLFLPPKSGDPQNQAARGRMFLAKRMHCSNWRFALFLLIMSGFWTSFNQIFYTMPGYIRDFTNTRPLIHFTESIFGKSDPENPDVGIASKIATINPTERKEIAKKIQELITASANATMSKKLLDDAAKDLLDSKVRVAPSALEALVRVDNPDVDQITNHVIITSRQVNPEFIVNFDAGAIVLFQVLISFLMAKFHRFTTMILGMVIAAVGIAFSAFAGDHGMIGTGGIVWFVAGGIVIFAFGEMMASPTSQEYVGRIAPRDKVALYMGYYFLAVALGNLFGGILSGNLYGKLARDMQRPDLMWLVFGAIMLGTAIVFLLYNRFALPKHAADELMSADAS